MPVVPERTNITVGRWIQQRCLTSRPKFIFLQKFYLLFKIRETLNCQGTSKNFNFSSNLEMLYHLIFLHNLFLTVHWFERGRLKFSFFFIQIHSVSFKCYYSRKNSVVQLLSTLHVTNTIDETPKNCKNGIT